MSTPSRLLRSPEILVALAVLVGSSVAMSAAIGYFKLYLRKEKIFAEGGRQVAAIPTESESFARVGPDSRMPPEIEEVLGTTNYLSRTYAEKTPRPGKERRAINFHGAYYTGMIDTVPHVPDRCMVGAGLQLESVIGDIPMPLDASRWREHPAASDRMKGRLFQAKTGDASDAPLSWFTLPRDPGDIKLRVMKFSGEGAHPIYAGYFFVANGGTVSRAEEVRLLAFDLRSTYAYYLKVEFQSHTVESPEELAELAAKWLDENFADVMRCTPDWVKVESGEYPPDNPRGAGSRDVVAAGQPAAEKR